MKLVSQLPAVYIRTPLQEFVDQVASGDLSVTLGAIISLVEIVEDHRVLEAKTAGGELEYFSLRGVSALTTSVRTMVQIFVQRTIKTRANARVVSLLYYLPAHWSNAFI